MYLLGYNWINAHYFYNVSSRSNTNHVLMARLHDELFAMCDRNRDGSFATQANRRSILSQFADDLISAKFNAKRLSASDLKGRHVNALLEKWRDGGLSTATIKNRMAVLRWWAEKIGNPGAVKSNEALGIENRVYATNTNKALSLENIDLSKTDDFVAMSLEMQQEFGLRREESMKFQPEYALHGSSVQNAQFIKIKGSWTKGGRERIIPISNDRQRVALAKAQKMARGGSLIPPEKTYKAHMAIFEAHTAAAGIGRTHGLRHLYAQNRYIQLTGGMMPPALLLDAAERKRRLSEDERTRDRDAREIISNELGHGRIAITGRIQT